MLMSTNDAEIAERLKLRDGRVVDGPAIAMLRRAGFSGRRATGALLEYELALVVIAPVKPPPFVENAVAGWAR